MKKKIIVLSAAFMLLAGTVSASSINGDYKGNPIVKVYSNGNQLETDEVPAQIYDGHTVVPISLLRQIGASVTWNADTYSVDVKLPQPNQIATTNDTTKLKLQIKIADFYRRAGVLGDIISGLSNTFNLTATDIQSNYSGTFASLNDSSTALKNAIDLYNSLTDMGWKIQNEASTAGIDMSDIKQIFDSYYKSIDFYKASFDGLNKYYSSHSTYDYSIYNENQNNGFNTMSQARTLTTKKYFEFFNATQQ